MSWGQDWPWPSDWLKEISKFIQNSKVKTEYPFKIQNQGFKSDEINLNYAGY